MAKTKIEWAEYSWNPISGCTKISIGCQHCYAERMARRLAGRYGYPEYPHHFDVALHPDKLDVPLRRKKPTTYFVCSMSDLFHKDVPFAFIGKVFATIIAADWHTLQILTKRAERMQQFVSWFTAKTGLSLRSFRHIWLGITAENQECWEERREAFFACPGAVHFLSYEPALGPLALSSSDLAQLDQVICGGESGPGARPMHPDWARRVRDDCKAAGVAYFFKQHGDWLHKSQKRSNYLEYVKMEWHRHIWPDGTKSVRVGKKAAGRLLDGRTWSEFPHGKRGA